MAFQQPTSPANAHYLIPFDGIAGSPTASSYTDRDHQAFEPASPLIVSPRSDIDLLLAGETFPVSERYLPSSAPAYLREASSRQRSDLGSVILLPSSREYDASHPNLDAHSAPPRTDLVESESFLFGEFGFGENVSGLLCGYDSFVVGAHLTTKRSHYTTHSGMYKN